MQVGSISLIPLIGFSGNVLIVIVASGPSPPCVTPARLMLYFDPGVKFSRWYFNSEADILQHSETWKNLKITHCCHHSTICVAVFHFFP